MWPIQKIIEEMWNNPKEALADKHDVCLNPLWTPPTNIDRYFSYEAWFKGVSRSRVLVPSSWRTSPSDATTQYLLWEVDLLCVFFTL